MKLLALNRSTEMYLILKADKCKFGNKKDLNSYSLRLLYKGIG